MSGFEYEIKMGRSSLVDIAQILFETYFFDTVITIEIMANVFEFWIIIFFHLTRSESVEYGYTSSNFAPILTCDLCITNL